MLTLVDRKIRPDSMQDHKHLLLIKRMKNFKAFFLNTCIENFSECIQNNQ